MRGFLDAVSCNRCCCTADGGSGDVVQHLKKDVANAPTLKAKKNDALATPSSKSNYDDELDKPPANHTNDVELQRESMLKDLGSRVDRKLEGMLTNVAVSSKYEREASRSDTMDVDRQMERILKDVYGNSAGSGYQDADTQMKKMLQDLGLGVVGTGTLRSDVDSETSDFSSNVRLPKEREEDQVCAVLIHSAEGLRSADTILAGTSDPYAVCRLGPVGTWSSKPAENERQTEIVSDNLKPVWRFATCFAHPPRGTISKWELHIRVYDKDLVTADDFLGEVRIPFQNLIAAEDEMKSYQLSEGGVVRVMYGLRMLQVLEDEMNGSLLQQLKQEEKAALKKRLKERNKIDDANLNTRIWTNIVQQVVRPGNDQKAADVVPPSQIHVSSATFYNAPFGGLKFLSHDEDEPGFFAQILDKVLAAAMQLLGTNHVDAADRPLVWFSSPDEAAACRETKFGQHLPPACNEWNDMHTDHGMRDLCIFGVGSWYLAPVSSSDKAGHVIPKGAMFECNLEYMSRYPTRSSWITYGHTIYFGGPQGSSKLPGDILGIWCCHQNELVTVGQPSWEHAKAGFRSSLGTTLTLRDHLCHVHWILANGLMIATRSCLSIDHPLRRLLKQFYFNTASINRQSKDVLLPPGRLAHRTFAFTAEAWPKYFADVFAAWQWVPFPERMKRTGLPASMLEGLPLSQDGVLLWKCFEKYVQSFLSIFYGSDKEIHGDGEIVAFWSNFEHQLAKRWDLPELSMVNLVSLVADLMWWVTGGHESVGSIVEYLTSLSSGLPAKLADQKVVPDVQTYTQALIVISLTGIRQPPLMDDWSHIFQVESWSTSKRRDALNVVREFQKHLLQCSKEIQHRNSLRDKKCVAFDPRNLETSVSI